MDRIRGASVMAPPQVGWNTQDIRLAKATTTQVNHMDLGLRGKAALVCASSKGLGRGCASALAAEGADLVLVARGRDALEATARALRETTGVKVVAIAADITTDAGRALALEAARELRH